MLLKSVYCEGTQMTIEDLNDEVILTINSGDPDKDLGVATFLNYESAVMFSQALDKLILTNGKASMSTYHR